MSTNPRPERHVVFSCEIGADSGSDLAAELRRLADLADSERMPKNSVWGGYSHGGHLAYRVNPGITGESFRVALTEWVNREDELETEDA